MFVVVLHSMFGLREVELTAAERFGRLGHQVVIPDLFAGATTTGDLDQGFALMNRIGWPTIVDRARRALVDVPDGAALCGFSMGVGVIGELWPERLDAAAVFCLHATTQVPQGVAPGTPVQLHVGGADGQFAPRDSVTSFSDSARRAGAAASVYEYPGAGHFFTDESLPDHDAAATATAWTRILGLLEHLSADQE